MSHDPLQTSALRPRTLARTATTLTITLVLWASAFAGIRASLQSYSPGAVILFRFLIASLGLMVYAIIARLRMPDLRDIPALFLLGFIGITVYQASLTFGEQSVSAGTASFLIASVPCFTALLTFFFLKERLSRWGWLGIIISFSGVALISFSSNGGFSFTPGTLLVLLASFSECFYFILQKKFLNKYTGLEMATYTIWTATFFMLVFAPQLLHDVQHAALRPTLAIVYMGIFPAAIAYVTWAISLAYMPASIATSFLNIIPIISVIIAWAWLREIPTPGELLGGMIIILGVLLVTTRGMPRQTRTNAGEMLSPLDAAALQQVEHEEVGCDREA